MRPLGSTARPDLRCWRTTGCGSIAMLSFTCASSYSAKEAACACNNNNNTTNTNSNNRNNNDNSADNSKTLPRARAEPSTQALRRDAFFGQGEGLLSAPQDFQPRRFPPILLRFLQAQAALQIEFS